MKLFFLCLLLAPSAFALDNKMLAKDLWVKKYVPIIARDLCEGRIATCMGLQTDDCGKFYEPSVQGCADQMYDSFPEYMSGKDQTKKLSDQIGNCARPKMTDQVVRRIMANPKMPRKEKCLEIAVPKAGASPTGGALQLSLPGSRK